MINKLLDKFVNNERGSSYREYDLNGITQLLYHMGNPQKVFPSVHIAGTNGKGTTSWILASIFEKSGYKTGLYTSPHLVDVNERIRINNKCISDEDFISIFNKIEEICSDELNLMPTYFDILTAVAFQYFAENEVDVAVIETGLGGRLDSTNVITPVLSIITDISYDHTEILGKTIGQIAYEKSGIIKDGVPVITSNNNESGLDVITKVSAMRDSELVVYGHDFYSDNITTSSDNICFDYHFRDYSFLKLKIRLFPEHQVKNCSMSLTASVMLSEMNLFKIKPEVYYDLLPEITIPGRYEIISSNPLIIYDPAHNYSGIFNLLNYIESRYDPDKIIVVITLMADKAVPELLMYLSERPYSVIYMESDDPRSFSPEKSGFSIDTQKPEVILKQLQTDKNDKVILFTGTFRNYKTAVSIAESINNQQAE